MTATRQVRAGGADDLEALAPLWIAVHHRHVESMPELAPHVSDEETWRERGATGLVLGALPGNSDAIRLCLRRGYRPTWLHLSKFDGR